MKDLTSQDFQLLLGKIKSFLNITWDDEDTDIIDFIKSSIRKIDDIAGVELNYLNDNEEDDALYSSMCYAGIELLKNRVFYLREKALDDFEKNYQSEIVSLSLYGRIYKNAN